MSTFVACACSDDNAPSHRVETRIVTELGDTCGDWQTSVSGASESTRVSATCQAPFVCKPQADVTPDGESGNHFGFCLPEAALSCDLATGMACPSGLRCESGFGIGPSACFLGCVDNADCAGEFQICMAGDCRVVECPTTGGTAADEACGTGNHCQRGVCTKG
jgi:hypothetical protein